ncbi:type III-A CRISPR-associated RAMP protein Csm3 [Candidatus Kuenenia sp.]|uniref:type III-A CRISPR-associated RAMP protein Csm3 n=1 Tax=Candidatus Kuenenia sp. TaxID=2499824 RepID=UPI00321F8F82
MEFITYKTVTGIIRCVSGLRIGGSKDTIEIGGMDNPIIRNPLDKFPYIPGSSIKGKIRSLLEWEIDGKLGVNGNVHQFRDCNRDSNCPICRIFGVTDDEVDFGPGRAIFRDGWVTESSKDVLKELQLKKGLLFVEEKTETAIDRLKGKAKTGSLRQYERVPAGTEFSFRIDYRVFDISDQGETDKNNFKWLLHGLWLLEQDALGGSGSRGYGQVQFGILKGEKFMPGKVFVNNEEEEIKDRYLEITGKNKRI